MGPSSCADRAPCPHSYAAAYVVAIASIFFATMKKVRVIHAVLWVYDQYVVLTRLRWTRNWGQKMATVMRRLREQPVCVLVKTDEVRSDFWADLPWDPFLRVTARPRELITPIRSTSCSTSYCMSARTKRPHASRSCISTTTKRVFPRRWKPTGRVSGGRTPVFARGPASS